MDAEAEDNDWVNFEEVFVDYEQGPPLWIHKEVTDDCYKKAISRPNLAIQLVKKVYSREEQATSICAGDHGYGKKKLSQDGRMRAVKNAVKNALCHIPSQAYRKRK